MSRTNGGRHPIQGLLQLPAGAAVADQLPFGVLAALTPGGDGLTTAVVVAVLVVAAGVGARYLWGRRSERGQAEPQVGEPGGGPPQSPRGPDHPESPTVYAGAVTPAATAVAGVASAGPGESAGRRRGQTVAMPGRPQVWAQIVGLTGPHANASLPLWSDRTQIGARPGNDIVLCDDAVSGHHATVVRVAGEVQLADRDSTNGTYVNGQRISRSRLTNGDRIRMGQHEYVFQVCGE